MPKFVAYTFHVFVKHFAVEKIEKNSEYILREISCNGNVEWTCSDFEEQKFFVIK